jgi:hypothetical protein
MNDIIFDMCFSLDQMSEAVTNKMVCPHFIDRNTSRYL